MLIIYTSITVLTMHVCQLSSTCEREKWDVTLILKPSMSSHSI